MNVPELSIVVVTFNSSDYIEACLQAFNQASENLPTVKIVVDNGSQDQTIALVKHNFSDWRIIQNSSNIGYGAACNLGIKDSQAPFILISNPDVVVQESTVTELLGYIQGNPSCGIAACQLINSDGTTQRSYRRSPLPHHILGRALERLPLFKGHIHSSSYLMNDKPADASHQVDWLLGSCMLLRRSALDAIGLFDERFFLYCEDVDLCWRMNCRGWQVTYYPQAQAFHHHQQKSTHRPFSQLAWIHLLSMLRHWKKRIISLK